jgi:hypothetical protein
MKKERPPGGQTSLGARSSLHGSFLQTLLVIMMYTEMSFIPVTEM